MPSSSTRKKVTTASTTTSTTNSRPSLIDTMLLTSTPLRRSPIPSSMHSTRSATNLTLQQIFKEKNQTYEDMQLLKMAKNRKKKEKNSSSKATTLTTTNSTKTLRKRSRSRKSIVAEQDDDDDETENDKEVATRKKHHRSKQKTLEEPSSKKLRRTAANNEKRTTQKPIGFKGKSSAGSSDGCTSADEEQEETRLIEQSKLYIEGPGIRQNFKKINEHNAKIGEKLQNLHGHSTSAVTTTTTALPSPILSRSTQQTSPVKIKTASRITFALPAPVITSPIPPPVYDPVHPPSPQMPPSTTATSVDTQTDDQDHRLAEEKECQTSPMDIQNQSIQTDLIGKESTSIGIQCQSTEHLVCRDLTVCMCVEQLVKTRQFLLDTTTKFQYPSSNHRTMKVSKQTMTMDEVSPSLMVLAKSSLKAEQQMIFEQFLSHFHIGYSATINDTTTHLITDALDENTPLVCPLTLKVIQATARHLPIISIQWLIASLTHQTIVPSQIYEIFLGDPTYGYHGGFLRSRIPRSQGLFQGIAFRLECSEEHGCPALLADNRALRELIYLCDGTIIDDLNLNLNSSTIIVLCYEIKRKDSTFTAYVRPEWLLASIAQYNLQPFQQFSVPLSS